MAKSTLRAKTELIIFWLCMFCLSFLIMGFITNSDLKKPIEYKDFYVVLRDSLTLLAYFLAPAIAWLVFSDWRKEHLEKKLESESEAVIKELNQIMYAIMEFYSNSCAGEKEDEKRGLAINNTKNILLMRVSAVVGDINRIRKTNINIDNFIILAKEITGKLKSIIGDIYKLDREFQLNIDDKISAYIPNFHEIDQKINEVIEKINNLNEEAITLKVNDK